MGNFGMAIEAIKQGGKVQRKGWNGRGMYIFLVKGAVSADTMEKAKNSNTQTIQGISLDLFDVWAKGVATRLPCFGFVTAQGSIVYGWSASQTDKMAEDWVINE